MFNDSLEEIVAKIEKEDISRLRPEIAGDLESKLESALSKQIGCRSVDIAVYITPRHSKSEAYPNHFRFMTSFQSRLNPCMDHFYPHEMGIREAVSTFVLTTLFR